MIFQDEEVDSDLEEQEENLEENSDYSSFDNDSEEEEQAARETFMAKYNVISWSSLPPTVAGKQKVSFK